ncbi:hypothetical protein HDU96_009940 [Phlyctochytrium bullatum]|nr:hypothetical protein HDU96_009940 [Phlyctochytrium bullatum]
MSLPDFNPRTSSLHAFEDPQPPSPIDDPDPQPQQPPIFTSAIQLLQTLFQELSESDSDDESHLSHSLTAPIPLFLRPKRHRNAADAGPTPEQSGTAISGLQAVTFPWLGTSRSVEEEAAVPEPGHPACGHKHPFGSLDGDVVFVPGFYGSNLNNRETDAKGWITMEMIWNFVHADVGLSPRLKYGQEDDHVPVSIIESIGPINICKDLVKEMKLLEACRGGDMRFHAFAYDWRRELQYSSEELENFLQEKYNANGNKPMTVIAHSMGGLITLSTLNRRPELFRKVVFVGTPFGPVPLIVWALRRGAPLIPNPKLLGTSLHFLCSWKKFCLTPILKRAESDEERGVYLNYLNYALESAKAFLQSLEFNPNITYPPMSVIASDRWPTPYGFRSSVVPWNQQQSTKPPEPDPQPPTSYAPRTSSLPPEGVTEVERSRASFVAALQEHSQRLQSSLSALLMYPGLMPRSFYRDQEADEDAVEKEAETTPKPNGHRPEKSLRQKASIDSLGSADIPRYSSFSDVDHPQLELEVPLHPTSGNDDQIHATTTANQDEKTAPVSSGDNPLSWNSVEHHFDLRLHYPLKFVPGDGVVAATSTAMPPGYKYEVVPTSWNHASMLNDLKAIAAALKDKVEGA